MIIDYNRLREKPSLQDNINALNNRKRDINVKMRTLARELRFADVIDENKLNEYQKLNESLRKTKIMEAELCYLKNML